MKFRFVWIGKTKDKNWKALQEEYLRRLSHFVRCEVTEVRDSVRNDTTEIEGKRILELLNPKNFVCLLESQQSLAAAATEHVDLGLGLCRLPTARRRAHRALLLCGRASGKPVRRGGWTATHGRLESERA